MSFLFAYQLFIISSSEVWDSIPISGKCLTKENKACYEGSWNEVQGKPGKGAVGCWQDDPSKKNWCATEVTDDVWHEYTKWGYCRMDMDTCTFGEFQC